MRRGLLVALTVCALLPAVADAQQRARWDTRVFALVPKPGFPANAYGAPNGRVYEGTYVNPGGGSAPSRVLEYEDDGTFLRSWTVRGQDLSGSQGVQVATMDGSRRLVLLDHSPPRVLLLDRTTGDQTVYARFPAGAVPNHAVWGPSGELYVTDYESPVLWRVPPGGGEPVRWLEDDRLNGLSFGTTGIGLKADRRTLLVAQQSEAGLAAGNPTTGRLFDLPIAPDGKPGPLAEIWESRALDAPDAFGIAKSGRIYIALLLANQIAVIEPDGREAERFPADGAGGANGSPVPFDTPSSARFHGDRLLVANQSFLTGDAAHQAILDVYVGEQGLPELTPPAPARAKAKAKAKAKKKRKKKTKKRLPARLR